MVGRNSIIDGTKLVVFGKSLQGKNIQGGFENVSKKNIARSECFEVEGATGLKG